MKRVDSMSKNIKVLAFSLLGALAMSSCAKGNTQASALAETEPSVRVLADIETSQSPESPLDERLVRLRAEAWPATDARHPWRVVEEGEGVLITAQETPKPWRVVMLSREPSAWADGLVIQMPPVISADNRPSRVQVRVSPTPREITRSGWPAVSRLLDDAGSATIPAGTSGDLVLHFRESLRVSIVEVIFHDSHGAKSVGFGKISLLRVGLAENAVQGTKIELRAGEAEASPIEEGALEGVF